MSIRSKNEEIKQSKVAVVAELKEKFKNAASVVVLDYRGLTVAQDTEMRNEFRKANVEYKVVKNRMMQLALAELGFKTEFADALNGPSAIAVSTDDVVAPAKVVTDSIKKYNKMAVKAGLADGKFATVAEIEALSKIPSKEVLIGQLLGLLTNPMRSLAVVCNEHAKQLEANA